MRKLAIAVSGIALTLSGCQRTEPANTSNAAIENDQSETESAAAGALQVADDVAADVCTSADTQDALRSLLATALQSTISQNGAVGMYQGDLGFIALHKATIVKNAVPQIEFSSTTHDGNDVAAHKTLCSTGLGFADASGDDVQPRLTFAVQGTLDGDRHDVVTLLRPIEVSAAISPLATVLDRAKAKNPPSDQAGSSSATVGEQPEDDGALPDQQTTPTNAM